MTYVNSIPWTPDLLEEEVSTLTELLTEEGLTLKQEFEPADIEEYETRSSEQEELEVDSGVVDRDGSDEDKNEKSTNEVSTDTGSVTTGPAHEAENELIDIVRKEIELNIPALKKAVTQIINTQSSIEDKAEAVNSHKSLIERLMLASESIGLSGLTRILGNINDNVKAWYSEEQLPTDEQKSFLLIGFKCPIDIQ